MRILQVDAAKIAGVSRAMINTMSKKIPRPGFFVEVEGHRALLVDTEHPDWGLYLEKRKMAYNGKVIQGYTEEKVGELITALGEKIIEICDKPEATKLSDALDEIVIKWERGEL